MTKGVTHMFLSDLPETMTINKANDIFSYKYEDFVLTNYQCHDSIKAPVTL